LFLANNKEGDIPDFELRGEDGLAIDADNLKDMLNPIEED